MALSVRMGILFISITATAIQRSYGNVPGETIMLCRPVNALLNVPIKAKPSPTPISKGFRATPRTKEERAAKVRGNVINKEMEEKISKLEERVAYLEKLNNIDFKRDEGKTKRPCPLMHRGKCFIFLTNEKGSISFNESFSLCAYHKGNLANIYDKSHFNKVERHARELMKGETMTYFILGMQYNKTRDEVRLNNNNFRPKPYTPWYSSRYPSKHPGQSRVFMQVNKDSTRASGMYNTSDRSLARMALCEIVLRNYEWNPGMPEPRIFD